MKYPAPSAGNPKEHTLTDWIVDVTDETKLRGERTTVPADTEDEARTLALEITPADLNTIAYINDASKPQVPPIVATIQSGAFDFMATQLRDALNARIEDPTVVTD